MTETSRQQPPTASIAEVLADLQATSQWQERLYASEDFSIIPDALGTPYTYWGLGGTDAQKYQRALEAGRVEQDIPVNHSEYFAPVIEPTLSNGTQALVVAALTYLSK